MYTMGVAQGTRIVRQSKKQRRSMGINEQVKEEMKRKNDWKNKCDERTSQRNEMMNTAVTDSNNCKEKPLDRCSHVWLVMMW